MTIDDYRQLMDSQRILLALRGKSKRNHRLPGCNINDSNALNNKGPL